jgi:tetratricopeptide (TPR) repeat protein
LDKSSVLSLEETYKMAKDLDEKGHTADALELYGKTLEIDPNFTSARIRLAYIYYRLGGHKTMQKQMNEAFKRDPIAILEYDTVFWGTKLFDEWEIYKERSINDVQAWEGQLACGWFTEEYDIAKYKVLFFRNEKHYYQPNIASDAELLIYQEEGEYPEYLMVRRRGTDGNFYNFLCRFRDNMQFNTGVKNNFIEELPVFGCYLDTMYRELEISRK